MTYKLIGSAASLEALIDLLKQRWGWSQASALESSTDVYNVISGKGPIQGLRIIKRGKRFRLEMEV